MPKITQHDIIYMYWTQTPKPVFLNKTLIKGLLEFIKTKDTTNGFSRMIIENKLT